MNSAHFGWNSADGSSPAAPGNDPAQKTTDATATFTVTEPNLSIVKKVNAKDSETAAVDGTFTYAVVVTNVTGANVSDAHHVKVVDTIPDGVIASAPDNSGVIAGQDATTGGGGTITWTDLGPVAPGGSVTLTYTGTFVTPGHLAAGDQVNTAAITDYYSVDDTAKARHYQPGVDGAPEIKDTATVTPKFPQVTIAKAATGGTEAWAGTAYEWTVTATNAPAAGAAKTVTLTDTLPVNWAFDAVTSVTVAGTVQVTPTSPTGTGTVADPLVWAFDNSAASLGTAGLEPGKTIVIVYTAKPTTAALTTPGVDHFDTDGVTRVTPAHTNTVRVSATDFTDATGHSDGNGGTTSYSGPEASASTHIHSADVKIVKSVELQPMAGQTGKWKLVVTNSGPDAADGPFTVIDSTTPPTGFTMTGASGTGRDCTASDYAAHSVSCTRIGTLAVGASFDPITITYDVAPNVLVGTSYTNSATVSGMKTHDPDTSNNEDDETTTVTTGADLEIVKTLVGGYLVAGFDATYELVVKNYGPSDSAATITVTDAVPDGTTFVSASGTGWVCTVAPDPTVPTITCTRSTLLADGATAPTITVVVKVDRDRSTAVVNTATVTGTTPDPSPDPHSNTSTVTKTPDESADLKIDKVHDPANSFVAGGTIDYAITVENLGEFTAQTPKVTDSLPMVFDPATIAFSNDAAWTCTVPDTLGAPLDIECVALADLAKGDSISFTVSATLKADYHRTTVTNEATVSSDTPDPVLSNNKDTDTWHPPAPPPPVVTTAPTSPVTTTPTSLTRSTTSGTSVPPTIPTVVPSSATSVSTPPPPTNVPGITTTVPEPDQCVGLVEHGFDPGETVTITVTGPDGQYTITAVADANGDVAFCVQADEPVRLIIEVLGEHHVVVREVVLGIGGELPNTGVPVVKYLTLALLLLAAGAALVLFGRRRQGRHSHG